MTEEEQTLSMQHAYILGAKRRTIKFKDMLTNEDVIQLVNALITFKNVHLIANEFKDDKIAYSLYEELKVKFSKD